MLTIDFGWRLFFPLALRSLISAYRSFWHNERVFRRILIAQVNACVRRPNCRRAASNRDMRHAIIATDYRHNARSSDYGTHLTEATTARILHTRQPFANQQRVVNLKQ